MPVLSPHRSSASALAGSYRSTFSSSTVDRPYFSSTSYSPRITTYSERYTTRSYADSEGRRLFSRSGSITEDGLTTRFREDTRESSARRDSLGSVRESSVASERGAPSRLAALDSVAELRNRYSPANYVPACLRERNENVARSKSISDIGLPPLEAKAKKKVTEGRACTNGVASNSTNENEDANGNRTPSVADLRRRFDDRAAPPAAAESRFRRQEGCPRGKKAKAGKTAAVTASDLSTSDAKLNVDGTLGGKDGLDGGDEREDCVGELRKNTNRVNNFASYISSRDFLLQNGAKGDCGESKEVAGEAEGGETEEAEEKSEFGGVKRFTDITASPKLSTSSSSTASRSALSPSTATLNSTTSTASTLSRRSTDREGGIGGGHENNRYATITTNGTAPVKTLGLNGLKNIGNTCFMNSVIQCLSNTKLVLEYLLKDHYVSDINTSTSSMKGALIRAFAEVIKELWSEDASDRVVNTTSLKSQIQRFAPRFIGYAQQDAQEFLRYLLEGLHEDVNRVKEKPKAIVTEIDEKLSDSEKSSESWSRYLRMDNSRIVDCFVGQLKSTLKCTHCGHCSVTFDPFWDLSLPIPQRAGQVRLAQCLDSFTREETLDGDEKPTCSKCKERRKCTKSFTIQKFPRILVIHLKRFSLAERFRGKLSVTVDFPLEGLDMSHYAADHVTPCRYNLYAISNHSGTTYSGHYTAYCRHPYTKTWHEYNDSRVSSISSKSIVSGEAYVLFYEQEGQKSHL